jgi:hypothetical protein
LRTVIVSTHFDDAVLSCWSVVDGSDDVDVVTVFTDGPPPGIVTAWDRDTGVDSATRMVQRTDENRAALALAGRTPIDLGLLEGQYDGGTVDPALLEPYLRTADTVYVPAAIGVDHGNPEHGVVRDVCLQLRPDACLYADQPYCLFRADVPLELPVSDGRKLTAIALTPTQRTRKAAAISCYAGEIPKLERQFGSCTDPDRLAWEGFWVQA